MTQNEIANYMLKAIIPEDPILHFSSHSIQIEKEVRSQVDSLICQVSKALEMIFKQKDHYLNLNYLPDHLKELFHTSSPKGVSHPNFRIDCIYNPNTVELKLIEINSADPSGFGLTDYLYSKQNLKFDSILLNYKNYLLKTFTPLKKIVTVIEDTSFVRNDFVLLKKVLEPEKILLEIFDPKEITEEKLSGADLVIRDYLDEVVSESGVKNKVLYDYFLSQKPLMNPISSLLGDLKAALPDIERLIVQRNPESAKHFLNSRILDNIEQAFQQQNKLVLKKSYSYGGTGVFLGKYIDSEKWKDLLTTACKSRNQWIVQEYYESNVSTKMNPKPFETVSFWSIDSQYAGGFGRRSSDPVVNVNKFGQLTPIEWV